MAKYQFNTQNHMRIWFSGNPDIFLNDENQLRMVKFRHKNPRAKLTFLYSSNMLNPDSITQLKIFCDKQDFTPLDFDTELLTECTEQIDFDLHKTAKIELDAYVKQHGGNLAAASDITRLITPLIIRGTYSDFDTNINVESLPDNLEVDGAMLLNIGSIKPSFMEFASEEIPLINNDIIGVTMEHGHINPAAKDQLMRFQKNILTAYNQGVLITLQQLRPLAATSILIQYFNLNIFKQLFEKSPHINVTDFRLVLDQSTRNIFSSFRLTRLEDKTALTSGVAGELKEKLNTALENVTNKDFPDDFTLEEQTIIKTAYINNLKLSIKNTIAVLSFINPSQAAVLNNQYTSINDIDDPEECYRLLQLPATGVRTNYLIGSVTLFSGPVQYAAAILDSQSLTITKNEHESISFKAMSFDKNNLFEHFNSNQSFRLGTSRETIQAKAGAEKTGTMCDLSWLSQGKDLITNREEKLHASAQMIQRNWKNHLNQIKGNTTDDNIEQESPRPIKKG